MEKTLRYLGVGIAFLLISPFFFSNSQMANAAMDTINQVDENGHKFGHWVIYGHMKKDKSYSSEAKVEEGKYESNKRTGLWKKYFPNGSIKSRINYKRNIPNGDYVLYYENGKVQEEGTWKNNRNVNGFKRYYKSGQVQQDFLFASNGKRNGEQKYFHENGQMEVLVNIVEGKESGELKRWYANGDIKETKTFNDGIVDETSIKKYEEKKPEVIVKEEEAVPVKVTEAPKKTEKTNLAIFKANGKNTLYNKNMQLSQTGMFKNGKLKDGKWYRYNKDGILERIEIYKGGKYVGDAVIEEE
ncbi:MAG: hypothetical protein AAF487_01885 [Bacteroidota bacterium]